MRLGISTIFPKHVLARKKLHVMSSHDRVAEMPPVLPQLFRAARKTLAQDGSLSSQNLEHLRGLICEAMHVHGLQSWQYKFWAGTNCRDTTQNCHWQLLSFAGSVGLEELGFPSVTIKVGVQDMR